MIADIQTLEYLGLRVIEHEDQGSIEWALLEGANNGHRVLVVERTYREGRAVVILGPTNAQLERARAGAWEMWNDRSLRSSGVYTDGSSSDE